MIQVFERVKINEFKILYCPIFIISEFCEDVTHKQLVAVLDSPVQFNILFIIYVNVHINKTV